jgi:hypothetical protein
MTAEAFGNVLADGINPIIVGGRTDSFFESIDSRHLFLRQIAAKAAGAPFEFQSIAGCDRVLSQSLSVRISILMKRHVEAACPFSN